MQEREERGKEGLREGQKWTEMGETEREKDQNPPVPLRGKNGRVKPTGRE